MSAREIREDEEESLMIQLVMGERRETLNLGKLRASYDLVKELRGRLGVREAASTWLGFVRELTTEGREEMMKVSSERKIAVAEAWWRVQDFVLDFETKEKQVKEGEGFSTGMADDEERVFEGISGFRKTRNRITPGMIPLDLSGGRMRLVVSSRPGRSLNLEVESHGLEAGSKRDVRLEETRKRWVSLLE